MYLSTGPTSKIAQVLTDNGSNAKLTVVPGYYASGTFTADGPHDSCRPLIAPPVPYPGCNAIEVTANQSVPQIFFGGFNSLQGHAAQQHLRLGIWIVDRHTNARRRIFYRDVSP